MYDVHTLLSVDWKQTRWQAQASQGKSNSKQSLYIVSATQNVGFNSSLSSDLVHSLDTELTAATAEACSMLQPQVMRKQSSLLFHRVTIFFVFSLWYVLTLYLLG